MARREKQIAEAMRMLTDAAQNPAISDRALWALVVATLRRFYHVSWVKRAVRKSRAKVSALPEKHFGD